MRIALGDGRRLCLVLFALLARVACAPDRPETFLVVPVAAAVFFFDPLFGEVLPAALDAEAPGFFGVDGESEV
jgi:hypothetical protein